MTQSWPIRVVKLGGSLLELADLAERLERWLGGEAPARNALVVGGGRFADAVRAYDAILRLPAADAHLLAIRAMSLSAAVVRSLLPQARSAEHLDAIGDEPGIIILDVFSLWSDPRAVALRELPAGWDVTSDSIAAQIAVLFDCAELVLLKSALPEPGISRQPAAEQGFVDRHFPVAATGLSYVRVVNLRDAGIPQQTLD